MKLPIVGQAYSERSKSLNAQRCINLYPVGDSSGGKNVGALYGTPGLELFVTLPSLLIRGMLKSKDGFLYVVTYNKFYQVDSLGAYIEKGDIDADTAVVSMSENLTQIIISDSTKGYIWDGATLAAITDEDFIVGGQVTLLNGYFIASSPSTDTFFISAINDGTTWDALEFSSANVNSDNIVTLLNSNQELWLFGEESIEVWSYDANVDFPFSRIDGATMDIGCAAKHSVVRMDNGIFWLSQDNEGQGQVIRVDGYSPRVVSTGALDYAIAQYTTISDAVAFGYQAEGHSFYVITFPSENATWCYDAATGLWHERAWTNTSGELEKSRMVYHQFFAGFQIVSDHTNGNLYKLKNDTYTDNGVNITRLRSTSYVNQEANRLMFHALQIDMETGVGLTAGGQTQVQLRWSDDGARTWSNAHIGAFGKIGEYLTRVIWRRLGASRSRTFEIRTVEPVKIAIIDAYVKVTATDG